MTFRTIVDEQAVGAKVQYEVKSLTTRQPRLTITVRPGMEISIVRTVLMAADWSDDVYCQWVQIDGCHLIHEGCLVC